MKAISRASTFLSVTYEILSCCSSRQSTLLQPRRFISATIFAPVAHMRLSLSWEQPHVYTPWLPPRLAARKRLKQPGRNSRSVSSVLCELASEMVPMVCACQSRRRRGGKNRPAADGLSSSGEDERNWNFRPLPSALGICRAGWWWRLFHCRACGADANVGARNRHRWTDRCWEDASGIGPSEAGGRRDY